MVFFIILNIDTVFFLLLQNVSLKCVTVGSPYEIFLKPVETNLFNDSVAMTDASSKSFEKNSVQMF